jgi:hypothetical protein
MKIRKRHRRALRKAAKLIGAAAGLIAVEAIGEAGGKLVSRGLRRFTKKRRKGRKG